MKTVEFKLSLNQSQQAKVNEWLNVQRWVWNHGLHLLEEFDAFTAWDKESKGIVQIVARSILYRHRYYKIINLATHGSPLTECLHLVYQSP